MIAAMCVTINSSFQSHNSAFRVKIIILNFYDNVLDFFQAYPLEIPLVFHLRVYKPLNRLQELITQGLL